MTSKLRRVGLAMVALSCLVADACSWRGANSLPLPGTRGRGPGAYTVEVQLPDAINIQRNARVRVGDVTVGNITDIKRQGWHALLTLKLDGDVDLPANATAKIGQTSLLGSLHVELAPPRGVPPQGKLHNGSLIPLSAAGAYPTTEQTLAAVSLLLNNGGLGQVQDITKALSTAFAGRERDLHSLITQLDTFTGRLQDQTGDIIKSADSLNNLVAQFADSKPVLDRALRTIPDALATLSLEREHLSDAADQLAKFSALTTEAVNQSKDSLIKELKDVGPVIDSLANAGPALTRSLSMLATFPWPNETMENSFRGDYANLTGIFDFTLSRIDQSIFTGTRWEGKLTELELQWGRTVGQFPSPYTAGNPLTIPYHWDQGQ